jgi:NhaP-type Na+/H+ and K+/H+ antiporter
VVQDTEINRKPVKIFIKNNLSNGVLVGVIYGGFSIYLGNKNPASAGLYHIFVS